MTPTPTALHISADVREGRLDPVEVVSQALCRAHETAGLHAFAYLRENEALAEAAALLHRPDLHDLPLAGVPVAVKDTARVAGHPCREGSAATSSEPANADDPVVARFKAAGAVVLGATTLCEGALWLTTEGPTGITRNPWNVAVTPGGSSGGSAVAVAAGVVPIAHGTDAMGSVRIPAAFCGILGIKPGRDVVDPWEQTPHTWFGISEHGVMARSAADLALGLSAIRGGTAPALAPTSGTRVGVVKRNLLFGPAGREYRRAAREVSGVLARAHPHGAGAQVTDARIPTSLRRGLDMVSTWLAGAELARAAAVHPDALQARTRRGAQASALLQVVAPRYDPHDWARFVTAIFDDNGVDVLLTPVTAARPPAAADWWRRGFGANFAVSSLTSGGFTGLVNLSGFPAMAVPSGVVSTAGTPVGVQLAGRPGSEPLLLALAERLGAATGS